jgi:hypothetical protein
LQVDCDNLKDLVRNSLCWKREKGREGGVEGGKERE